jgi:hypothetical protein
MTILLLTSDMQSGEKNHLKALSFTNITRNKEPRTNQSLHNYLQWEQPTVVSCWNLEAVPGAASLFLEFVGKLLAGCQVSGLQVV